MQIKPTQQDNLKIKMQKMRKPIIIHLITSRIEVHLKTCRQTFKKKKKRSDHSLNKNKYFII